MIKSTLFAVGILSVTGVFGQINANHIEIAVHETVKLKPTQVEVYIKVETAQSQIDREFRNDDYEYMYEYEYNWYESSEQDYIYEEMMRENPKKVTKQMKQEYEQRQKEQEAALEEMERARLEREKMNELLRADFDPFDITEVMGLLDLNDIKYTIVDGKNESGEMMEDDYDYDEYYDEYDYYRAYSDSVLSVVLLNAADYTKLNELLSELPIIMNVEDISYETNDTKNSVVIPKLTEKATKEAQALATSFGRKLGKVIQCTNVYPFTPSENYMKTYMGRGFDRFMDSDPSENPFDSFNEEIVEYVYRFELLN